MRAGFAMRVGIWGVCAALLSTASLGAVTLPGVFGDNMVLQRRMPIPVWGQAVPGEEITVSFLGQTAKARAGEDGKWQVKLPSIDKGGPDVLTVTGKPAAGAAPGNAITFSNVVVGEVWLCSGQSNMQFPLAAVADQDRDLAAATNSMLRHFSVPHLASIEELDDVRAQWEVCAPGAASNFSAVAYFFGRELFARLKVPIGLINSAWGGTRIEPWTPLSALRTIPDVAPLLTNLDAQTIARLQQEYDEKIALKEQAHQKVLALEQDEQLTSAMAAPGLDTAGWKTMRIPAQWEHAGLSNFDGLVWFRKELVLPAGWAGKELVLHLGPVDEADVTSFNGVPIGGQGSYRPLDISYWDKPRTYRVPGALVRAGTNVLAVRVIDSGYAGGLWGAPAEEMRLELADAPAGAATISVAGEWLYKPEQQLYAALKPPIHSGTPSALFNAMIRPLIPYGIRGAIWYQGEGNWGDGMLYRDKLVAMILGWRAAWQEGPFPFYYVQLAPYIYGKDPTELPKLWQAQKAVMALEHTGMAVITDLGNVRDIHPRRKREVGRRLALWALSRTYGVKDLECSGPLYRATTVSNGEVHIQFDHAGSGLASSDGESIAWFDLAEGTGAWSKVQARIAGDEMVISNGMSKVPLVRFGWHEMAQPNLVNREGLPASPFSTEPEGALLPKTTPAQGRADGAISSTNKKD